MELIVMFQKRFGDRKHVIERFDFGEEGLDKSKLLS